MSNLSNDLYQFADCLHPRDGSDSHVLDDIFAVGLFAGFSVIQSQLLYRLSGHLRNGDFKSSSRTGPWFGIAHVALGAGYLVCAILAIANFMMKLGLVSQHTVAVERNWPLMLLLSDGLLLLGLTNRLKLYRCFILFEKPWLFAVILAATSRLGWFIFVAAAHFTSHNSAVVSLLKPWVYAVILAATSRLEWFIFAYFTSHNSAVMSLLTPLLTSTALVIWLWREKSKAKVSTEINQISYDESIGIVLKAALPPIILGFIHIWLLASISHVPVAFNAFWLSFTVLASPTITLSVFEQGDRGIMNGKPDRAISLPSKE
ncbi:hypothetical protein BKA70DRAFT_1481873 [Coprinopsis sp. MPI-PUGE-AT-0042]|nr:hypothetical protein BKA70DRAFT_1481873 [Coprinopsis sp. MPI-PUGE-AT-0042]